MAEVIMVTRLKYWFLGVIDKNTARSLAIKGQGVAGNIAKKRIMRSINDGARLGYTAIHFDLSFSPFDVNDANKYAQMLNNLGFKTEIADNNFYVYWD